MEHVRKIHFPYPKAGERKSGKKLAVFFGTDFYNLPEGSNRDVYIERTNKMLAYIQKELPDHDYVYLPHPNEREEFKHLQLGAFTVHKHTIADLYMWKHRDRIAWTFSTCSWASGSAYAFGIKSAVFLDTLHGAVPDDAVAGWHQYFDGFPKEFFITSFDRPLPNMEVAKHDNRAIGLLEEVLKGAKRVWLLAADPALGVKAAMLAQELRVRHSSMTFHLLKVEHPRWKLIEGEEFMSTFNSVVVVPHSLYSIRPRALQRILKIIFKIIQAPIQKSDAVISFNHTLLVENAVLSYKKPRVKILLVESRWFHFTYEGSWEKFPRENFKTVRGLELFQKLLRPTLGLYRVVFLQYQDGKVLDYFRYKAPLEKVYDAVFVTVSPQERV